MKRYVIGLCAGIGLILSAGNASALSVTSTGSGATLASTILGSGISISNVAYNGSSVASGTFTGGVLSGIGIESGIVLTSGSAQAAVGPNTSDSYSYSLGLGGDANLNSLIPGYSTYDATVLEFDFITSGGNLFFNYVFASEEYNEWTNTSFNDVFGFFLDGSNIALIPGTSTAVSINNVNGGNPYGTNASHPEFFNNNDPSNGGPFFDLQYDGFTDVFTATALGLSSGTHHIKLAIADAGDSVLDSAVFIQSGSFSNVPTPTSSVPEPGTFMLLGSAIAGFGFFRRFRKQ